MRPSLAPRTNAATARSISSALRTSTGRNSTPNEGATAWSAPNCPLPEAMAGLRSTATRVTRGAISLRNSSHFALMPYSNWVNPVILPPGRAMLSTKAAPTGSDTPTNTIGTVEATCCNAITAGLADARKTSGASAASSAAYRRWRSSSFPAQRMSIRMLRSALQPNSRMRCKKAAMRDCPSASSAIRFISTPMRRIRSACCARAASGHAPPRRRAA